MASSPIENPLIIENGFATPIAGKCGPNTAIAIVKSGRVCTLKIIDGIFTASENEPFAVVPVGFRPSLGVDFLDSYSGLRTQINTEGQITSNSALLSTILRGSVSYISDH